MNKVYTFLSEDGRELARVLAPTHDDAVSLAPSGKGIDFETEFEVDDTDNEGIYS